VPDRDDWRRTVGTGGDLTPPGFERDADEPPQPAADAWIQSAGLLGDDAGVEALYQAGRRYRKGESEDEEVGRMLRYMQAHGTSINVGWSVREGAWAAVWWSEWGYVTGHGATPFEAILEARNEGHRRPEDRRG
jgi:hypothetical protein